MPVCPHCGKPIPPTGDTCPHCGKGLAGAALLANPSKATGVSGLAVFLLLIALGAVPLGLLFLSQATAGVGILAIACLFAIIARIAQASTHHSELMNR